MSGYYQMARGWMENDVFSGEPYTEREAWQWLIEQAAWKPSRAKIKGAIVALERGQASFSVRFMADKWQWSKSRVDRFLKRLVAENMVKIASKNRDNSGTTAGHPAGQGQSIITICNYEKYQSPKDQQRDSDEAPYDTEAGQQRDKEEEGKKEEERKEGCGRIARGTRLPQDFRLPDEWRAWAAANSALNPAQIDREGLKFADYWRAKSGRDAAKLDWLATWRNWVRNVRAEPARRSAQPDDEMPLYA